MRMFGREIFPLSPSSNSTITPPCFPSSEEPPAGDKIALPQVCLNSDFMCIKLGLWLRTLRTQKKKKSDLCVRSLGINSVSVHSSKHTPWFLH